MQETQQHRLLRLSGAAKGATQSSLHPAGWDNLHPLLAAAQQAAAHLPQGSTLFSHPLPGPGAGRELRAGTFLAVLAKEASRTFAGVGVVVNLAGPPVQAGLRVAGGWHCCKAKHRASLRTYNQGLKGCSPADNGIPAYPSGPHCTSLPGAGPASLRTRLTVVGAVVSVADAEVAPAILHAVPAVRALRVHVARGGGDFCKHTASAGLRQPAAGGHPAGCLPRNGGLLTL